MKFESVDECAQALYGVLSFLKNNIGFDAESNLGRLADKVRKAHRALGSRLRFQPLGTCPSGVRLPTL